MSPLSIPFHSPYSRFPIVLSLSPLCKILLCKDGKWQVITVDDFFPVKQDGSLLYSKGRFLRFFTFWGNHVLRYFLFFVFIRLLWRIRKACVWSFSLRFTRFIAIRLCPSFSNILIHFCMCVFNISLPYTLFCHFRFHFPCFRLSFLSLLSSSLPSRAQPVVGAIDRKGLRKALWLLRGDCLRTRGWCRKRGKGGD